VQSRGPVVAEPDLVLEGKHPGDVACRSGDEGVCPQSRGPVTNVTSRFPEIVSIAFRGSTFPCVLNHGFDALFFQRFLIELLV
jgi:hypothetical protein